MRGSSVGSVEQPPSMNRRPRIAGARWRGWRDICRLSMKKCRRGQNNTPGVGRGNASHRSESLADAASRGYDRLGGAAVRVRSTDLRQCSGYFLHHLVERNTALFDEEGSRSAADLAVGHGSCADAIELESLLLDLHVSKMRL